MLTWFFNYLKRNTIHAIVNYINSLSIISNHRATVNIAIFVQDTISDRRKQFTLNSSSNINYYMNNDTVVISAKTSEVF